MNKIEFLLYLLISLLAFGSLAVQKSHTASPMTDSIRRDIVNDLHIVEKHGLVCAVYQNRHKGTGGLSCNWDAYNKRGDE